MDPLHDQLQSDEASRLMAWLQGHRLDAYHSAMVENGFDSVQDLFDMSPEELTGMLELLSVKPGHVLRFRRAVQSGIPSGEAKVAPSEGSAADAVGSTATEEMPRPSSGIAAPPAMSPGTQTASTATAGPTTQGAKKRKGKKTGGDSAAERRNEEPWTVVQGPGRRSPAAPTPAAEPSTRNSPPAAPATTKSTYAGAVARPSTQCSAAAGAHRIAPGDPAARAPAPSRTVEVLRLLPDGRLAQSNVPKALLTVSGTYSVADCAGELAKQLQFGHFGVPGVNPQTRLADRGAGVMVLQMRSSPQTYLLSTTPCPELPTFPLNAIATGFLLKKDMRCYGSALVLSYAFTGTRSDPQHTYSPLVQGQFLAIPGVKEALEKASKDREFEESYKAKPLAASAAAAAFEGQKKWGISSFGNCMSQSSDPVHHLLHSQLSQAEAKAKKAKEDAKKAEDHARSAEEAATKANDLLSSQLSEAEAKARKAEEDAKRAADDARSAKEAASKAELNAKKAQQASKPPETAVPSYWSGGGGGRRPTHFMKQIVQRVLRTSSLHHASGIQCHTLQQALVLKVERVENPLLWTGYQQFKQRLLIGYAKRREAVAELDPPIPEDLRDLDPSKSLDPRVNEVYLFHGTSKDKADVIAEQGFDARVASQGLYGHGVYFAHEACKALQYSSLLRTGDDSVVIVSRVILGDPYYASGPETGLKRPPERSGTHELWDSVIANPGIPKRIGTQVHREYVVYEHYQAYPEFIASLK